jgi:hypothetical protein
MVMVGGIYSPNHYSSPLLSMAHRTVQWCTGHDTVQCPVPATSVGRWGLERLPIEALCPLVAPGRCVLTSELRTIHCSSGIAVDRWAQLTVALLAHRTCLVHTEQSGEL